MNLLKPGRLRQITNPRSLRYKLLVRMLLILSFILMIIGFLQYFVMKDFLYRNESESLMSRLMSMPVGMILNEDSLPSPPQGEGDQSRFLFMEDFSLALIDTSDSYTDLLNEQYLQAPEISKAEYQKLKTALHNHQPLEPMVAKNEKGQEQLLVFRPLGRGDERSGQLLQMGTTTSHLHKILWQQLLTFIVLSIMALAAGLAIYFSVIRKTLLPLSTMVNAVKNINAANLAEKIPNHQGQEEIDRLADSFNEMLTRLDISFEHEKEAKEQMRRFIADASHELRTPLTSIHGYLEVLLRGAAERPDQLYPALRSMHGESKRIIKLVEELLLLAKLDRAPELNLTETNLTHLIREMEPQLYFLAGNRTVELQLEENLTGSVDEDKIKQVILNLFHNAVQHTDAESGQVHLSLHEDHNSQIVISIADNGPGISKENLSHIFDRFYRVDHSRTRQNGGAGLGLSITKSIVEAHGGQVDVESQVDEGSVFTASIPLIQVERLNQQ